MNNKSACLFIPLAMLVTGCGGSGSSDDSVGSGNSAVIANDVLEGDTSQDETSQDGISQVDTLPLVTGTGESSDQDVNAAAPLVGRVCAGIDSTVSYEMITTSAAWDGWYVPAGAPDGNFGWDGEQYCDLTSSQAVQKIDLLVPYVAAQQIVDGDIDQLNEWNQAATATWAPGSRSELLIRNLQFGSEDGYQDGSRSADFAIKHDREYLYIAVLVRNEDANSDNPQIFFDSTDYADDDSISIFIDADNSKGSGYDGVNDFHTKIAVLDNTWTPQAGVDSAPGLRVDFRTGQGFGGIYEARIDIASAGIEVGKPFGFDIQVNEDDNGGAADARFAWYEATGSNMADTDPSVLATIVLTGCADDEQCNNVQSLTGQ